MLILISALGLNGCSHGTKNNLSNRDRAMLFLESGNAAIREGDSTGALQNFKTAEGFDPSIADIHISKAIAYEMKGELVNAVESAKLAVKLAPDHAGANNTLGSLYLLQNQYSKAETYFLKAEADLFSRESYKAATNLGAMHFNLGNDREAMIHLNKAIAATKDQACLAYYYRGQIHLRSNRPKDAIDDLDKSVKKQCGNFVDGHYMLGMAYSKNRQYDKAKKKFLDIKSSFPDSPYAQKAMEQLRFIP